MFLIEQMSVLRNDCDLPICRFIDSLTIDTEHPLTIDKLLTS